MRVCFPLDHAVSFSRSRRNKIVIEHRHCLGRGTRFVVQLWGGKEGGGGGGRIMHPDLRLLLFLICFQHFCFVFFFFSGVPSRLS